MKILMIGAHQDDGKERGEKIRYAEAYEVCEYGEPLIGAVKEMQESVR